VISILDRVPIWAIYSLTVGLVLLAAEAGFRLGVRLQRRDPSSGKGSMIGAVTGAELGLLAFLLAFSIGIAANYFHIRRQLVVTEVNAIGTSYLRAGFLDEPDRSAARDLLREYVDVRLSALDPAQLEDGIRRSEEIHNQLWLIAERQSGENPESNPVSLFVEAVNSVIDVHTERLTAALTLRLPLLMWLVFYGTAVLTFFLVGFVSSADGKRNPVAWLLFALALAAVLMLIVDYDRTLEGLLTVSHGAMWDLQRQLATPMP